MSKESILIVEDEPLVARDLEKTLVDLGYEVVGAVDSGEKALETVRRDEPDLILMDIKLNGQMTGIETAGKIRDQFRIPIVYLTAHQNDRILNEAKKTGPFAYLKKPYNSEELRSTLEVVLDKHRKVMDERQDLMEQIERIKKEKKEEVERLAFHDPLTDLPNRFLFQELLQDEIEQRQEEDDGFGVLFLDVVGFQQINDAFGHSYGDRVLCKLAEKLEEELPEDVLIARWSGDVFAMMTPSRDEREEITSLIQDVFRIGAFPFDVKDHQFQIFCSVGVAMFPEHGSTTEDLITRADIALFESKKEDSNSYRFYEKGGIERIQDRVKRTSQIRRSIEENAFKVHYQPTFHSNNGCMTRVEALARWQHPGGELLKAGEFIPAAESSGLIIQLGELILKQAIKHTAHWHREHDHTPLVAINVSTKQLLDQSFLDMMQDTLDQYEFPNEKIEIEVTETTLMQEMDKPLEILHELKNLGVRVGVDDFGTGYSSLKYLAHLPVDTIKIDRYFTERVTNQKKMFDLVEIMHDLAVRFDLTAIIEGVETKEEKELLESCCDEIQGFYFSKPITRDRICDNLEYPEEAGVPLDTGTV